MLEALNKFPEDEKERIIAEIKKNQYGDDQDEIITRATNIRDKTNEKYLARRKGQFKVVFCTFAFKNGVLQKKLMERGLKLQTLTDNDDEETKKEKEQKKETEIRTINDEIQKELLGASHSLERVDLMTPQSAFVTFKNPFAAFLANKMTKIRRRKGEEVPVPKIFGKDLDITKVGYPTDTQYENYGISNLEKVANLFSASIIVMIWGYFFFSGMFNLY